MNMGTKRLHRGYSSIPRTTEEHPWDHIFNKDSTNIGPINITLDEPTISVELQTQDPVDVGTVRLKYLDLTTNGPD